MEMGESNLDKMNLSSMTFTLQLQKLWSVYVGIAGL